MNRMLLKTVCAFTAIALIGTYIPPELVSAAEERAVFQADINEDGVVDVKDKDAVLDLLGTTALSILSADGYDKYDANLNGVVDAADALAMNQYLNKEIKSLPANEGNRSEETLTLSLSDSACFQGNTATLDLSIVDWTKDIRAYDIVLHAPKGVVPDSAECTGTGRFVVEDNAIRIYGIASDLDLYRGKIATVKFKTTKAGEYPIAVDGANVFNTNLDYYTADIPCATLVVHDTFAPVSLQSDGFAAASAKLTWDIPFSNAPISEYVVYRDGKQIAETVETFYIDSKLEAEKEYTYTVRAKDETGTETDDSLPITVSPASPKIEVAAFDADSVAYTTSDLHIKMAQKTLLSELKTEITNGKEKLTDSVKYDAVSADDISHHLNIEKLESGEYPVSVTVTDIDGATDSYTLTMHVLNNVPAPLTLTSYAGCESATLTWQIAPEANVTSYRIYRKAEDEKIFTCIHTIEDRATLNYTDTKLNAAKKYTYTVTAVNSFGLESEQSNLEVVQPDKDSVIPEITLFTPTSGKRVKGSVIISIGATDNSVLDRIACLISADEGKTWDEIFTSLADNDNFSLDTTAYPDGIYPLQAKAYDKAGNQSADTNVISIAFDNTAPEQVKNIRLEALYPTQATLAWDDVADEDFSHFSIALTANNTTRSYTVNDKLGINLTGLTADTDYTVTVSAVDQTGNVGEASESFQFSTHEDTEAPVITAMNLPGFIRNNAQFNVTLTATDTAKITLYSVQISQDKKVWTTYSSSNRVVSFVPTKLKDGTVYVRAFAEDQYGNIGDAEEAQIAEVIADSTAPGVVTDINIQSTANGISLAWMPPSDTDVISYRIDYAVGSAENGYQNLVDGLKVPNYTFKSAAPDTVYVFRIATYDTAGNLGKFCDPVTIRFAADETAPVIKNLYLSEAKIVCEKCHTIQVLAVDESYLNDIALTFAVDGSDKWTALTGKTEISTDHKQILLTAELPESVYQAKTVTVRAVATDKAKNSSKASEQTFAVDNSKAEILNLNAKRTDTNVSISWECPVLTDVTRFILYRQVNDGQFFALTSFIPKADQTTYSYEDTRLETSGTYTYRLEAFKKSGNITTESTEPMKVQSIPKPHLIYDAAQKLGAAYLYDATGSTNADELTSLVLDYGDGSTDSASKASAAKFEHTYAKAGIYTVTLTCQNADGASASMEVTVTVEEASQLAQVTVTVKTTEGNAAVGATVYFNVGNDDQTEYITDANGKVTFMATAGDHEIGVFGNGFLPATKTVTLYSGANNNVDFSVVCQQLVDATFEIQRMTLDEIKAAGINVSDPANINVVKINVSLTYQSKEDKTSSNLHLYYDPDVNIYYLPDEMRNQGYEVHSVHTNERKEIDAIVLMQIPTEVKMLKEFFNVKMIIMNNADTQYTLSNGSVTLNVPSGMTLMENAVGSATRTTTIPTIAGGSSQEINWILRGDSNGDYPISANFNATLMPFNTNISQTFTADQTIHVNGSAALKINVNLNPTISSNRLLVEIAMKNVSSVPVYEVSGQIGETVCEVLGQYTDNGDVKLIQSRLTGTNGVIKVLDELTNTRETLNPGETFSLVYSIYGFNRNNNFKPLYALRDTLKTSVSGGKNVTVNIAPVSLVNVNDLYYGLDFDRDKDFLFVVRNHNGQSVPNAEISVYSYDESGNKIYVAQGTADERGRFIAPRQSSEQSFYVRAEREGYDPYVDSYFFFPQSRAIHSGTIVMRGDFNVNDYKITYASISTDTYYRPNILLHDYTITENDGKEFNIRVRSCKEAVKFELVQGTHVIGRADAEDGFAEIGTLHTYQFDPLTSVGVRTYTPTGETVYTSLHLLVAEDPARQESAIADAVESELGEGGSATITLPTDWVVFGGYALTISFPTWAGMGAVVRCTDNSFSVSVNGAAPGMDDYGNTPTQNPTWKQLKEFNLGKVKGYVAFGAYLEGTTNPHTHDFSMTGQVYVTLGASGEIFKCQLPCVVPIYVGLNAGVSISGGFQYSYSTNAGSKFRFLIKPAVTLKLTACFGYAGVVGAGFYGSGTASAEFLLFPPEVQKVTLSADVGIHVDFFTFSYDISLLKFGGTVYPPTTVSRAEAASYGLTPAEFDELYAEQNGGGGRSTGSLISPMAEDAVKTAQATWNGSLKPDALISTLQTNTTGSAAPCMITNGDTTMLVWCANDPARGARNSSYLVYSLFNAETNTWSEPLPIDDNQNADFNPVLFNAPDGIYIGYQESNSVFKDTENIGLASFVKQLSAKSAKFDAKSGKFTDFATITPTKEDAYISSPQFSVDQKGTLTVLWSENSEGNFFGSDDKNKICLASKGEEGWSEPTVVKDNIPALTEFVSVRDKDGDPFIAYVSDDDCSFATTEDMKLNIIAGDGTESVLATGEITSLTAGTLPQGDKGLAWMQDGALMDSTNMQDAEALLTTEYLTADSEIAIDDGYLVVTRRSETNSSLCVCEYDTEAQKLSEPQLISDTPNQILGNPALAVSSNGDVLYSVGATLFDQSNDELAYSTMLLGGKLTESENLSVDAVKHDVKIAAPNAEYPMNVCITNHGTKAVDKLTFSLLDADGKEINTQTVDANLTAGEIRHFDYVPTLPETFSPMVYTLFVSGGSNEATPDDNHFIIDLSQTDLCLEASTEYLDNTTSVNILLTNNSAVATPAYVTASVNGVETTTLLSEEIAPHTSAYWIIDADELLGDALSGFVTLTAVSEITDAEEIDNQTVIYLSRSDFDENMLGDIDFNGLIDAADATAILKMYVQNIMGKQSEFTSAQAAKADVDNNGSISAEDATLVLRYYVKTLMSTDCGTLPEFVAAQTKGGTAE